MRVLVVEDSTINLAVLNGILRRIPDVEVQGYADPLSALDACKDEVFDVVLVDYMMPGINGLEFIHRLRADPRAEHVPIVMITADDHRSLKIEAIEAGATDFLNKPIDPQELKVRVTNLLTLRRAQVAMADKAQWLAHEVEKATRDVLAREEEMIWRLARAIEFRDGGTGEHVSRVATISRIIAEELGMEPARCRFIYLAAPLHDVGKIGVPDAILNKPGRLSPEELSVIRRHVTFGGQILAEGGSELVRTAERIALTHHERWDGAGYPAGLAGDLIPIEGRIVAIADVFDALCTERPYKHAWTLSEAREEINAQSGRHFDPVCVEAFERGWSRIAALLAPSSSAISAA
jgi:putative two-component system response regulator